MRPLLALYIALQSIVAYGGCPEVVEACDNALQAQAEALKHAKEDIALLEAKAIEASKAPIVPFIVMFGVSVFTLGAGAALSVPLMVALGAGATIGTVAVGVK